MCTTTTTTRNNLRRNICWLFNVDVFFPKITKVPSTFAYVLQGTQALWFLACPKKALENGKKLRVRERNGGRRKPCYNCTVHTYFVACKKKYLKHFIKRKHLNVISSSRSWLASCIDIQSFARATTSRWWRHTYFMSQWKCNYLFEYTRWEVVARANQS